MATSAKFHNVILCEDIRDETGSKHSLMGVLSGDIVVPIFPATIQLACFMQCIRVDEKDGPLKMTLRIAQNETDSMKAVIEAAVAREQVATLVLPKTLFTFEKEVDFKLFVSVNGAAEELILSKKVLKPV